MSTECLEHLHSHFLLTTDHLNYCAHSYHDPIQNLQCCPGWCFTHCFQPSTIQALPDYFNAYFESLTLVLPKYSVHGNSASALFANFIDTTGDLGDGVLMTTPYYGYFAGLIEYPAQARIVPAHVPPSVNPLSLGAIQYLRSALENPSNKIRVVLLCNPYNPLAAAYPTEVIIAYAKLAEELDVHLLVDEVYALQVFPSKHVPHPMPFISILSLPLSSHSINLSRIHVIGSPKKAFGAAGLMVGSFISQHNPELVQVMQSTAEIVQVSSASGLLFTNVLRDVVFRDWFLEENRRRLARAFDFVADWCVYHGLPWVPPVERGCILCCGPSADLSSFFQNSSPYDKTVNAFNARVNHGVYPQPVLSSGDSHTTQFRVMFALPSEVMLVALRRIERAFGLKALVPAMADMKIQ